MLYRILSTSPTFGHYVSEPVDYLKSHGCIVEITPQEKKISEEELVQRVGEFDAVIVGVEKITAPIIKASIKLKIIAKHGAGVDNIDINTASSKGILVTSAPGANSDAVAELTFGLFLSLARRIPFADHSVKKEVWPRIVGVQVDGKVLGIIGLGQIGKRVAKYGLGFNMKVVAFDVLEDEGFGKKWGVTYLPLDKVLAESDFISLHVPLGASTRRLIGEREIGLMKKGAFLVNISRGDILDEEALYRALKEGKIGGAALDVFLKEPPKDNPLLRLDNVILTPHMGGYTFEALRETGMICAQCIVDVFEGRRPQFIVNPEVL